MSRHPERAYINEPYASPTAPRAELSSPSVDKTSTPVPCSSDPGCPQARSLPQNRTDARLRGGWDEEECCICCVCSCLACDQFCKETSTGSFHH
jgi:hypothetical protein